MCVSDIVALYTGYQLLIQPKLLDSCSHMTLMHEKTLLIQPNFSSKNDDASKNTFDPLSTRRKMILIRFRFWKTILIGFWKRTLLIGFYFWKKHFWSAGSKAFSHASASRDYIGLLDQTLDPRVISINLFIFVIKNCTDFYKIVIGSNVEIIYFIYRLNVGFKNFSRKSKMEKYQTTTNFSVDAKIRY